jgi:peptide/nickel transport system substrate-binding protein
MLAPPVYDMLMYNDVSTGTIVAQTAESLTSTDAQNWTLKIRPGIKFTDGTPYDAAAVKFNWLRLQDPANAATKAAQANLIATMTVSDPVTLQIALKAKNAEFPIVVTFIPFIASPTAVQAQGASYGSNANVVGAGPFILKSWQRDNQWVMVRNPNYWEAPLPYVDQLIVNPIADETQRMNTFLAGGANLTFMGTGTNADQIQKSGVGIEHTMILNGGIGLEFNTKRPPFNDVRARLAVAMAIDPVDYSKVVNSGLQQPITGLFRPDSPFYDPSLSYPWNQPAQAQQLIDQVAAENGGTFQFEIAAFATTNYALSAQYVQAKMNSFNHVKVTINTEASALHITNCTQGTFANACGTGLIFDDPEPGWTGIYTCNSSPSPTGWCNAQFDKDVLDNQVTLNAQQRIADIKDAQKQFYAEVPTLILERRYSWMFSTPAIQNFKYANDGIPLISQMWIKTH